MSILEQIVGGTQKWKLDINRPAIGELLVKACKILFWSIQEPFNLLKY